MEELGIEFQEGLLAVYIKFQVSKLSILLFIWVLVDLRKGLNYLLGVLVSLLGSTLPVGEQVLLGVSNSPAIDIGTLQFLVLKVIIVNSKLVKEAHML